MQSRSIAVSSVKCSLVNMAIANQRLLERWRSRVLVMLEKSKDHIDVAKLRAILLLEVDFDALNKIVFNTKLMISLKRTNSIPYEIIGERRGQSSIYIALNKKLVSDIANQSKKLTVVVSVDASNCYDRIAHPIAILTCQHFGLNLEYLLLLFGIIQILKMYLRTSFGLSTQFYTRTKSLPFQGGV